MKYNRNGRTDVLSAWNLGYPWDFLVDGGEYYYYPGEKADDLSVRFSHDFDEMLAWGPSKALPVTAFTANGSLYYYSIPIQTSIVNRFVRDSSRKSIIFRVKGGLADVLEEISDLWFKKEPADWERFCTILKKLRLQLPADYFRYTDKYDKSKETKEIRPVDFESTTEFERSDLRHYMHENLAAYIRDKEGISALAFADSVLFAGCRNGNLLLPSEELQEDGKHILHQFKYPINSMCTIDEETLNGGIRQRIVRNIQMRAMHAKAKPAALRRAA